MIRFTLILILFFISFTTVAQTKLEKAKEKFDKAIELGDAENFTTALKELEKAKTTLGETNIKEEKILEVEIYNYFCSYYCQSNQLEKGSEAISLSKKILEKNFNEKSNSYASYYFHNAALKFFQQKIDSAIFFSEKSIAIYNKIKSTDYRNRGIAVSNLGFFYTQKGEYKKSLVLYEEALVHKRKVFDENHTEIAVSYTNIGVSYDHLNQFKKALPFHLKALGITEKKYGEKHLKVALNLNNLAVTYSNLNQYIKSEETILRSISIVKKYVPSTHPYLGTMYNNLAVN